MIIYSSVEFPKNAAFRGIILRVEYMVFGIPHVPHSVTNISNYIGHPSLSCHFFSQVF